MKYEICLVICEVLHGLPAGHDDAPLRLVVVPHPALGLRHLAHLRPRVRGQAVGPAGRLGGGAVTAAADVRDAIYKDVIRNLGCVKLCPIARGVQREVL